MTDDFSWLVAGPCGDTFNSLRSSLAEATKLRPEDEDLSFGTNSCYRIALKCGHAKYQEQNRAWSLHYKSKSDERSRIESLGCAGKNGENRVPERPIVYRSLERICILTSKCVQKSTSNDAPLFPPLPLVKLIFRAVELISILERAMVEHHASSYQKISSPSKVGQRYIDVKPIFDTLWQLFAAKKSRERVVAKLLAIAVRSVADVACQLVGPWGNRWGINMDLSKGSGKLKSYLRASRKSIKYFVHACLTDPKSVEKPTRSIVNARERRMKIRSDKDAGELDHSTAFHSRAVTAVEFHSDGGDEEHYENPEILLHGKTTSPSVSDNDHKPSVRKGEMISSSNEQSQFSRFRQRPATAVHRKSHASPQSESGSQDVSISTSPVTGATIPEQSDIDSSAKKTEIPPIRREMRSNIESLSESKEYHSNKEQSLLQSESRKCREAGLTETLNLIVDEDSCASQNDIDEVSSRNPEKPSNATEQQSEARHQEFKLISGETALRDLNSTDSVSEEPLELCEVASRTKSSIPDHFAGSEMYADTFDKGNNSWVMLSHMGHISDYHGYQRQHQSFVPLKYSTSVSETCASLGETLKGLRSGSSTKVDEDADSDQEDYEAAVLSYSEYQDNERAQRSGSTRHEPKSAEQLGFDMDLETRPLRFIPATSVDLPNAKKRKIVCLRSNYWIPTPSFKSVETDPITFWRNKQKSAKRPRRTEELNELKKISVMMLSEMYHTLLFIKTYNAGFLGESKDKTVVDLSTSVTRGIQQKQISKVLEPSESKTRHRKTINFEIELVPKSLDGLPLKTIFMKTNFKEIQKQFVALPDLPNDSKFQELRATIESAIGEEKVRIYSDEEIIKEEKSRTRIARGYKRKADQEKIEKKHHEDERLLQLREFEYANRNKKASAMELEMERFVSRPIMVNQRHIERSADLCQLGTSCILCTPEQLPHASSPQENHEVTIIHNPRFRRVDLDAIEDDSGLLLEYDTVDGPLRSLMEMQHILTFMERYSKGLIR